MKKVILFALLGLFTSIGICQGIKEVKIGEQIWMSTNLNVDKFRNGDPIPQAKTKNEWVKANNDKKPAWCYYQNNAENGALYGKLYNWYAVHDPRGLGPKGWHVPTASEWNEMISYLRKDVKDVNEALKTKTGWKQYEYGGFETGEDCIYCDGTGLHKTGRACWICGGTGGDRRYVKKRMLSGNGTNTSGFSAKPGANRFDDGDFNKNIGLVAVWWLASETKPDETSAEYIYINNDNYTPETDKYSKGYGSSVRLVKDDPEKIERERIALEEKKKKELLEQQMKEEKIKQEKEQEKLRILEAEKKEQERKLQAKLQDSLRKREKEISDSIKIENLKIELANDLIEDPISYSRKLNTAEDDWKGTAESALPFLNKYLNKNWRIPTIKEMRKIMNYLSSSYCHINSDFLCMGENKELVVLHATGYGGAAAPITFKFQEIPYDPKNEVRVRFVSDK